ncbi:hypothetical protein ACI65C_009406 [Semiaphis heraclei]
MRQCRRGSTTVARCEALVAQRSGRPQAAGDSQSASQAQYSAVDSQHSLSSVGTVPEVAARVLKWTTPTLL